MIKASSLLELLWPEIDSQQNQGSVRHILKRCVLSRCVLYDRCAFSRLTLEHVSGVAWRALYGKDADFFRLPLWVELRGG